MKKNILKGLGCLGLLVALVLTSCKNDVSGPDFIYDVEPDASVITVKAYPGFNYVTWTYVDDNATIYVYRDDGTEITPATGEYYYVDVDIQDGVTYKYTAYTVFTNDPVNFQYSGTDVSDNPSETTAWKTSAATSSDSCKAINPSYIKDNGMMTALELCEYEKDANSKFVINEKNIVMNINDGNFQVAWPTKNYLVYTAYLVPSANIDIFGLDQAIAKSGTVLTDSTTTGYTFGKQYDNTVTLFYTNNGTFKVRTPIKNAGKYKVAVKVSAVNDTMYDSVTIVSKDEFNIEALDVTTNTNVIAADYIDEGKTIRILWNPAVKADTSNWGAENYTVYSKEANGVYTAIGNIKTAKVNEKGKQVKDEDGNVIYEFINAAKADAQANEPVLYCDFEVPDNKVSYNFDVVLSDNGKYEEAQSGVTFVKTVAKFAELPTLTVNSDPSVRTISDINSNTIAIFGINVYDAEIPEIDFENDVNLNFKDCVKDFVIKSVKYKTISKFENGNYTAQSLIVDSEMTETKVVPSADYTQYDILVKDVALDNKVVFLVQVGYKGYQDAYFVLTSNAVTSSVTLDPSEYSYTKDSTTAVTDPSKFEVTLIPGTYEVNKNYTYKAYWTKLDVNGDVDETSKWTEIPVTITKDATTGVYSGKATVTFDPATAVLFNEDKVTKYRDYFAFKFEKINKHTNVSAINYSSRIEVTKDAK